MAATISRNVREVGTDNMVIFLIALIVIVIIVIRKCFLNPKVRIVERTNVDGRVEYVIQQRHFLFGYWCDAWINSFCGAYCDDYFATLEEAQKNLCYFDGSKIKERVVQ